MRLGHSLSLSRPPGLLQTAIQRILALSPSALYWPAQGAGWQNTTGGTLAASGQPVGLLPDLSQLGGKTLAEWLASAPELVTNGGFDTDTAWTKGTGWTISGGTANFTATGSNSNLSQAGSYVEGRVYEITVTATVVAGQLNCFIGSAGTGGINVFTASGTQSRIVRCASGTLAVFLQASATFTGAIDNISVKELPGNHLRAGTWASPADSSRAFLTAGGALNFDGVNDYYSLLNAIPITEQMTVVRAFKRASASISSMGLGSAAADFPHEANWFSSNTILSRLANTSTGAVASAANTSTGSFVTASRRTASTETIRLNGTEVATGAARTAGSSLAALGRRNTVYNSGEISFLAVFPTELTGADLALVEQIAAATNGAVLA